MLFAASRQDDHRLRRPRGPHRPQNLQPAAARQNQVQQQEIVVLPHGHFVAEVAVARLEHAVTHVAKCIDNPAANRRVVLNGQYHFAVHDHVRRGLGLALVLGDANPPVTDLS